MKKTKRLFLRLTEEQMKILKTRTINEGYMTIADYVRATLFFKKTIQEQVEELIHEIKSQQKQNNQHKR